MGYSHTIIVPHDLEFIPGAEQVARGICYFKTKLKGHYGDDPLTIHTTQTPQLYSTEENWTEFVCPRCKKTVYCDHQDDEIVDWWYMELYSLSTPDQILTVPCCNSQVSGREFDFGADAVFSKFALSIQDFNILDGGYFNQDEVRELESALGFRIRIIIAQGT